MITYTAGDRTPFTYVVTHIPSGKKYYGSRYALHCKPEDLWTTYFTSSRDVKKLIETDGQRAFRVEIRKIFNNVIACRRWETRFLNKIHASTNDAWINGHNGGARFYNTSKATQSTKNKMSIARKGKAKSQTMKTNAMWYYELKSESGILEYIKGSCNVLQKLGRKDWESVRIAIQRRNGFLKPERITIRRMPKTFRP